MQDIKFLIFDLEGVIINSEPAWEGVDNEFLRRRNIPYDIEEVKPLVMGRSLVDGARALQEKYGFDGDPEALGQERRDLAKVHLQAEIDFMPGFMEFFTATASKYPRAIATALERDFLAAIDAKLHLSEMFNGYVYSIEDIGFISKPNPDIFLYAAKNLGADPDECLVIEDAPNGVVAAKAAGMQCVAITNTVSKERLVGADQIIDTYSAIVLQKKSPSGEGLAATAQPA
jgi:beta-phosphoglucomutase-like phosphatase (HAD superfamily)